MTLRERDNYVYLGIIIGCVLFLVWIIPANSPPYPGYGVPTTLMPNVAVGLILFLALLELLRSLLARRREKRTQSPTASRPVPEKDRVRLWHFIRFMAPCVALLPAMHWVGFIPAGLAFLYLLQYLCGQRNWLTATYAAVGVVGFMYAAMRYGLGVPMP